MKRNWILIFIILISGGLVFYACHDDDVDFSTENEDIDMKTLYRDITDPDVLNAIQWFDEHPAEPMSARANGVKHPLFHLMCPYWCYAYVDKDNGVKTVEIPVEAKEMVIFTHDENILASEQTRQKKYIQSLTRLVLVADGRGEVTDAFFMTISPSRKYMDAKDFSVFNSTYFERDEDFDGTIYFHDYSGEFVNGWRYSDGKITHIIRRKDSGESLSRGGHYETYRVCEPRYNRVCAGHYETTESGMSVYVEDNCYDQRLADECHDETRWVEDGGGEYDPDKKPKCPYKTPGCPGGENCTCCSICKGHCTSAVCPKCGKTHCKTIHLDCKGVNDAAKALTQELFDDMGQVVQGGDGTMTLKDFEAKVLQDPSKEHAIVLNKKYDSALGEYNGHVLRDYAVGDNGNVTVGIEVQAEAKIHTHPESTTPGIIHLMPPSAQDLEELVSTATGNENYPYFNTSYVFAEDNKFALTITDRAKAKVFLQNNPNFVGEGSGFDKNSDVGKAYYEAQEKLYSKYGKGIESDTYALAYALQKADAGVQLSWKKKGESQFTVYMLKKVQNGNSFEFFVFNCL